MQFFSVLTGLWLATSLLTGVQALNSQARDSYARASQLIGGEPQASLSAPGGGTFPQQWFVELRRQGWPVSPVLQARVLLKDQEDQRLQLMGIDPVSLPPGAALAGQAREMSEVVAFFTDPGRTWIAPQTLQALGLTEGDRPRSVDGQSLPPLHAQEDMAPGVLLMDIGFAQQVLGLPEQLSRLLLPATFSAALPEAFNGRLQLKHADEENNLSRLTESFHPEPRRLGFFILRGGAVHRSRGHWPGPGATPQPVANTARLWRQCAGTGHQPDHRIGRVGLAGRDRRGAQRLLAGEPVVARCRGEPAGVVRRRSGRTLEPQPMVVVQRCRPESARCVAGRR